MVLIDEVKPGVQAQPGPERRRLPVRGRHQGCQPIRRVVGGLGAIDGQAGTAYGAGHRAKQATGQAQQRALARAVGPHHPGPAGREGQVQLLEQQYGGRLVSGIHRGKTQHFFRHTEAAPSNKTAAGAKNPRRRCCSARKEFFRPLGYLCMETPPLKGSPPPARPSPAYCRGKPRVGVESKEQGMKPGLAVVPHAPLLPPWGIKMGWGGE